MAFAKAIVILFSPTDIYSTTIVFLLCFIRNAKIILFYHFDCIESLICSVYPILKGMLICYDVFFYHISIYEINYSLNIYAKNIA